VEFDFDFGQELTNGAGSHTGSKATAAYNVGKMDALREAKRDLDARARRLGRVCAWRRGRA
jgi:hypothetical protein